MTEAAQGLLCTALPLGEAKINALHSMTTFIMRSQFPLARSIEIWNMRPMHCQNNFYTRQHIMLRAS